MGRYKVLYVHEYDLYLGNRDAVVIFGGIRVETPVELVVAAVQSDQLFKGIPVFLRFRAISGFTN